MNRSPEHRTFVAQFRALLPRGPRAQLDRSLAATVAEAFAEPGCPLCRLLSEKERRSLESLLWEQVNDPMTADRLAAARGFCWEHTWALVPAGAAVHSHLGVAILLERLLRSAYRQGTTAHLLDRWLQPDEPCPVCEWLAVAEETLVWATAELAGQDAELLLQRPGLLCRPHARAIAQIAPNLPWNAWDERIARLRPRWSHLERLEHDAGRRPWFLPQPATLPECCPDCLMSEPQHDRLWAWFLHQRDATTEGVSWERCLGHAANDFLPSRAALAQLLDDLAAFIAAADHRFRGELTPGQRSSWLRAITRSVGTVPAAGAHERLRRVPVVG
ncbi:MAG: hypothetical protein NZL87_01280 [Thermomicrobium sp.]|nr:hypothetical protein [Thermomicrobium sp.]